MRRLSVSLLFLAASAFTFAQTPALTSSNPPVALKNLPTQTFTHGQVIGTVGIYRFDNFGCPVGFSASRQSGLQLKSTSEASQTGPVQGLHLNLHRRSTPDIASIEVTVYGIAQKGLYLPLGTESTRPISKTFELHRVSDDTSLNEADVMMRLAGTLNAVNLNSITYADGTTWHSTANFQCRAVPSNLLLVGSR